MHRTYILLGCLFLLVAGGQLSAQQKGQASTANQLPGAQGGPINSSGNENTLPGSDAGSGASVALPDYFCKHLTGTIGGRYHIVMNLMRIGSKLVGDYYYVNKGIPLFFGYGSTISKDGSIHLVELNQLEATGSSSVTGTFDGRFVGINEVSGTWKKADSSSSLPFAVTTVGLTGGPFDIEHYERAYYDRTHASAKMEVTFPVVRTDSTESDAALNANIVSTVIGLYENGVNSVPPTSIHQAMADFISSYTSQFGANSSRSYFPPWTYSITASVLFNSNGIVSVRYEAFSFEGGAHPNTVYKNASYVVATGSVISLDDLLVPGYESRLNALGLKEFRKERGIKENETLPQAGYFVSAKDFRLNKNFMITQAGLLFQFNQYEIAPYYFGAQQVLIPYSDLQNLLLPNSPVAALAASSATASTEVKGTGQ